MGRELNGFILINRSKARPGKDKIIISFTVTFISIPESEHHEMCVCNKEMLWCGVLVLYCV